jgi:hypothetical protein
MTVIESIIKDLQGLPNAKLVEAAGMIHRLSEKAQQERAEALQGLYGVLSQEDGGAVPRSAGLSSKTKTMSGVLLS